MSSRTRLRGGLSALMLLFLATPTLALKTDRKQPLDVAADRFETSEDQTLSVLTGKVRISQGSLQIDAEKATIQRSAAAVERVELEGGPARLEQDLDDGSGRLKARAARIDYDLKQNHVLLTGNVVVQQPRGELSGERISYDLGSGRLTGGDASDGSRVHIRMLPQKDSDATDSD